MIIMERLFPGKMEDFPSRLGLSQGNAPGRWAVLCENPEQLKTIYGDRYQHYNPLEMYCSPHELAAALHPRIYEAIKNEITGMQFVEIDRLTVGAVYLSQGQSVEIEDRSLDLANYLQNKKAYFGFRMGDDALYFVFTNPLGLNWERDGATLLFQARAVLSNLVKGNLRSDFAAYLPEFTVLGSVAKRLGLKWARSLHENYSYGDRSLRHVEIWGQLPDPRLSFNVFLFDNKESIEWLQSQADQFVENETIASDDGTVMERIMRRIQGRELLVIREDSTIKQGVEANSIESSLDALSEALQGVEFDLSSIAISVNYRTDPKYKWKSLLGR
jgi:hypothetical protein